MTPVEVETFIASYVGMWHEHDPQLRRKRVYDLWAEDAENITRRFIVRGLAEILPRVDQAHEEWVAKKGFMFRPAGNTDSHHNLIKFFWEMLPRSGGRLEARGLDIFVLNARGKIQSLYQFPEALPPIALDPCICC